MIRIATRGSALALAQAGQVAELLGGAELVEVSSDGEPGDKGALRARGRAGAARRRGRHRRPLGQGPAGRAAEGLTLAAVPPREDPADVWIGAGASLDEVAEGARVGTASLRRRAQLLAARPDLEVERAARQRRHPAAQARRGRARRDRARRRRPAPARARGRGRLRAPGRDDDPGRRPGRAGPPDPRRGRGGAAGGRRRSATERALLELTAERAVVALLEATCDSPLGVHGRGRPRRRRG